VRFRVRNGWLAAAALAGFVLVALAARARPAQREAGHAAGGGPPSGVLTSPPPRNEGPIRVPPPDQHHHFRLPWSVIGWLLLGVLIVAVVAIIVTFWPRMSIGRRARRAPGRARPIQPAPDDLIRQVSNTLRSTMSQVSGGQIRDGVILCWHRLEQTAEAAGLRRSPADTSSDLVGRLLASMPVSEAPLNRLAALYREARFSSHPIPAEAVAQARSDLAQLRSELEAAAGLGAGHG
jgi:hypothetical protein